VFRFGSEFAVVATPNDQYQARDTRLDRTVRRPAVMANNDVTAIATFDTAFDHVPGVSRASLDVLL
jgi:hypothetical protein